MQQKITQSVNSLDKIFKIATGFQPAKVLFAAVEFDIFSALGKKKLSAEEIARLCKLPPRSLKRLLNGLVSLDLIVFENGRYQNSSCCMKYLIRGKPEYLGGLLMAYNRILYQKWGALEDSIRHDTPQKFIHPEKDTISTVSVDLEFARSVMIAQHNYSVEPAKELAQKFNLSPYFLLLDLGGGTGIFSIMAVKKYRKLNAIVFDFAPVCAIAQEMIARNGLSGRVRTHAGNILQDSFPPGADVILISGVLDGHDEQACKKMLHKTYDYLPKGGTIIIKESIIHDKRTGPLFPVLFSLALLIETKGGDARSRGEMTQWLQKAGFKKIRYMPLNKNSGRFRNLGVLTAVK